ncbi:MAG TPA: hypothetical protein PKL45_15365, partial [Bacteroidia bacterium]|nr:hypothetical protein [Bacteroidia bacterium]
MSIIKIMKGGSKMTVNEAIKVLKTYRKGDFVGDDKLCEAIDTVLLHINTGNKTGLDERLQEKSIEQPDNQEDISNKKDRLYTAKDMKTFAEWLIGRSEDWITDEERCETAETIIEMWEKERGGGEKEYFGKRFCEKFPMKK